MLEPKLRFLSNSRSSGVSAFYVSRDLQYVFKAIPEREYEVLQAMLEPYATYVSSNPGTLLTRLVALYTCQVEGGGTVRVLVMQASVPLGPPPSTLYDLKGSTAGRVSVSQPFKDLNLIEECSEEMRSGARAGWGICLGVGRKGKLMRQVEEDVGWLKARGVMDYSLLVSQVSPTASSRTHLAEK